MKVSIHCPHCKQATALSPAPVQLDRGGLMGNSNAHVAAVWRKNHLTIWWIGVCNYCGEPVLVENEGKTIWPNPIPDPTDERVPEKIRRDLDEAKSCLQVGAFCAAAVMSRRVIQQVAIDKGHTKGNLVNQIDAMAASGLITADVKEWAHVVRWVGNEAAHPSESAVEEEDAKDIIQLADQLLQIVYVAPAIAKNRRDLRSK